VDTTLPDFLLTRSFAGLIADSGLRTLGDVCREDVRGLARDYDTQSGYLLGSFGIKSKAAHAAQLLVRKCGEMFADRVELASCAIQPGNDAGTWTEYVTMHFYSFEALNGDTALHGCLKQDGIWSAMPRDSNEYNREKMREDSDRTRRALEKLQTGP
jgi:hypothetical protein